MKNNILKKAVSFLLVLICTASAAGAQTLIMNEVSNGPAGNQEYVELVVVSDTVVYSCGSTTPPCIDIRGWIFDDNSGYHGSAGVASGAVRFSQNAIWACVPVGTIILIYNNGDRNPAIPADDLSMADGNCRIIAPLNNTALFESNSTTPGAGACSYPPAGWTPGGNWNNTVLANAGDCARIVNLAGCEVFSVCWGSDNANNLIYMSGSAAQKVYYFNGGDPSLQSNWSQGSASPSPGLQTPGSPNNAANASYIARFNNGCMPITPPDVTASPVDAGCTCNGSATAAASGSIGPYTYAWYDAGYSPTGQTTATAAGLCAGTYHVIARSSIGCTDTATVTINSGSAASVSVNSPAVCAGQPATLTATPAVGGGTYLWSPGGAATQSISVSPAASTTYTVAYTQGGCTNTAVSSVTVDPLPSLSVNSPTICAGQNIVLAASGAAGYSWSTGASGSSINVSPAVSTSYTVTGTTAGCSATATAIVGVNPSPSVTVDSAVICAGESAVLTASGAAGYIWSTGATGGMLAASPAATASYTVTGTTAGCSDTAVALITVRPVPSLSVNSPAICAGQNAVLTASGAPGYSWSAGATATGTGTALASPAATTSYTVTGTTAGCSATAVATVTVNAVPSVTVNSVTICPGSSAVLTASGAAGYSWNTGATGSTLSVSPVASTSYTVTGTTAGCSAQAISTVGLYAGTAVDAGPDDSICYGGNALLAALPSGAAFAYSWLPAAGLSDAAVSNPVASPAATTTYTVTLTDTQGCSSTDSVTVYADPALTAVLGTSVVHCNGNADGGIIASVTGGSGSYAYAWNTGDTTADVQVAAGNYTVLIRDSWGCTAAASATVTEPPVLAVTAFESDITCFGACSGQATALAGGGTGSYGYSWNSVPAQGVAAATGLCAGSYTCTVTDANGCTATAAVTVTEPPALAVAAMPDVTICSSTVPASLDAVVSGGSGSYIYSWSPAAGLSDATVSNPVANPSATTLYTVHVSDVNGCSTDGTVTVHLNPPLTVVTENDATVCPGGSAVLSAAAGGGTGYTYQWSPAAELDMPSASAPVATPSVTTTYTVTVTDACASSATATETVTVLALPEVDLIADTTSGCIPLCVQFTDTTGLVPGSIAGWSWNFGDGQTDTLQSPYHCYQNAGPYTVSLTLTGANGCTNTQMLNNYINAYPLPGVAFTSDVSETSIFSPTIQFANETTGAASWSWDFGDHETSVQLNPAHTFADAGSYPVWLYASTAKGCSDSVEHTVVIEGAFTFYAPNAFTPDGNLLNSTFLPKGTGWDPEQFDLMVFDRWGNLCFESRDMHRGWDGVVKSGSEAAQMDVYVWKVALKDLSGNKHSYTGTVTIVK